MKKLTLSPADDVQAALNSLTEPCEIFLKNGIYRQKLEILSDFVTIIGENRQKTVITYDDYAKKIHADGREFNTFRTYTLCASGEGARLENLTIENPNAHPEKVGQCVALSVNALRFSAKNCNFCSTQDTLFLAPFPDDLVMRYDGFIPRRQLYLEGPSLHLFENCLISGTVDFIFGGAKAYFKGCRLLSLRDERGLGYVAAPAHPLAEDDGFVFCDCDLENGGAAQGSVCLARPWRDFGKSVFIDCRLGSQFSPELFDKWNDTSRDKTARFAYYNLKSAAPLSPAAWSRELTATEAENFRRKVSAAFENNG